MTDMSWVDQDYGFDPDNEDIHGYPTNRTIERLEDIMPPCPAPPGLEKKYQNVWVNFTTNDFWYMAEEDGSLRQIPRSEWMEPEAYQQWLSARRASEHEQ